MDHLRANIFFFIIEIQKAFDDSAWCRFSDWYVGQGLREIAISLKPRIDTDKLYWESTTQNLT